LKNQETVVVGIDQAVGAFIGLFEGKISARWWWNWIRWRPID